MQVNTAMRFIDKIQENLNWKMKDHASDTLRHLFAPVLKRKHVQQVQNIDGRYINRDLLVGHVKLHLWK